MRVMITGVQNAVEESIIKIALERIEGKAKFKILSFSDFVDTEGSPADELKLLQKTQKKIRDTIQVRMIKSRPGDHIIIEGYCTVKSRLGFFPIVTKEILDVFKPDFMVNIEVDPAELAGKLENRKEFEEHQEVEKAHFTLLAANVGCGIRLIRTELEGTRKSAEELYGMLKDLTVSK